MKIYITRHSKTIWNEEHRLQGWKDSPLTKEGIEDAMLLKKRLQTIPIDVCISSPIKRAYTTATILFDQVLTDERLKEMNFGDYEGKKVSELSAYQAYYDLWHCPYAKLRLPNGESLLEVQTRLRSCIDDLYLQYQDKTVFLTVHGMVFIVLLSIVKNIPLEELTRVNAVIRGCSLSSVSYDGKDFIVHYIGDDSHLPTLEKPISYSQ